jgi:proteasome beta subunit
MISSTMKFKKGTTTVGLVCKDGVVLAADRRATAGTLIVDKKAQKIHEIGGKMAVTLAGAVADAQLLIKLLKAEVRLKALRTDREPNVSEVANLLAGYLYSNIRRYSVIPGFTHFVLGGSDNKGVHLYDLFPDGSVTLIDDYTSSGSGSVIAYGVLETQYRSDLTMDEAIRLAVKAVNAALQRDTATGNGIDAVKITERGVERVFAEAIESKAEVRSK